MYTPLKSFSKKAMRKHYAKEREIKLKVVENEMKMMIMVIFICNFIPSIQFILEYVYDGIKAHRQSE